MFYTFKLLLFFCCHHISLFSGKIICYGHVPKSTDISKTLKLWFSKLTKCPTNNDDDLTSNCLNKNGCKQQEN